MAKRKRRAPGAGAARRSQPTGPETKAWTLLVYLCGDNKDLDEFVETSFKDLCAVGASPQMHMVVQCDRLRGARRYVLPEGPCQNPPWDPEFGNRAVNTGVPKNAIEFLQWGVQQAPAERVAVVLSGLGINPDYAARLLTPQESHENAAKLGERIQERLFSLCHDQTSHDALEAHQLSEIFEPIADELDRQAAGEGDARRRRVDLVGLDLGAAAFVELAYQICGAVDVLVASQRPLPDAGWPYQSILRTWQECCRTGEVTAEALGRLIVDAVVTAYPAPTYDVRMAALALDTLQDVARVLDTVSLAIMQSLGDWHVLNALRRAGEKTLWISPEMKQDKPAATGVSVPKSADFLPAVDMLDMIEQAHEAFRSEAEKTPEQFGQRERMQHLSKLLNKARALLNPTAPNEHRVLLHARPTSDRGLSILMPPPRTAAQIHAEKGRRFSISSSNYLKLRFSSEVHWPAMMGAYQLITEKPHTLWRLISSMLADASGPARDALLQRLMSDQSVLDGLRGPFKSLTGDAGLTLSLEARSLADQHGGREYLLRLESSGTGATVDQQVSRVYQSTVDAALTALELLLQESRGAVGVEKQLAALGQMLGEDLIQRLAAPLKRERDALVEKSDSAPHLRLQIPPELMRYPWELMHDGQGLLCERFAIGRQVFTGFDFSRPRAPRKSGPIQVLVIGDPQFDPVFVEQFQAEHGRAPRQLPGARNEAELVVEAFRRLHDQLAGMPSIEVRSIIGQRLSCFEMRELLRSGAFDIIHYAGHANFVSTDPEGSAWLLSDGPLRAREIRNTLAWSAAQPWLVFANACQAGMDAGHAIGRYQGDVFGLATAFIHQGVAAYIAPLWPVDDHVAADQAVQFYGSLLLERRSLGEALHLAKRDVRIELIRDEDPDAVVTPREVLSWASVVLYGDPTRRLLESLWSPQSGPGLEQKPAITVRERPKLKQPSAQQSRDFRNAVTQPPADADEPRVYPVWFGTNRLPRDPQDLSRGFTGQRDDQVHYGTCKVVIPETHKFGSLGSAWWKRWLTWTDDRVRLAEILGLAEALFWEEVQHELAARQQHERVALVYIHGFNVSFQEAAVRAAQIGFDLKVPGLTAFFSWPSKGRVSGYVADGSSIEASEPYIADFLTRFATNTGAERVHIIAHSMGNRGLLRSLQRLAQQASAATKTPFGQILLAAPDVDSQTFADLARVYKQLAERTTLYASARDLALASSGIVNDAPRAGFLPPVTIVEGIDTVEVSQMDLTLLGHSYYGGAEGVLYDMHELLMYNSPPQRRTRLSQRVTPDRRVYWSVQR